jgi:HK97 family phage major capsid protein
MSNIIQDIADAKQKRKKVHEDQRAITNTARKEQRALTADEETAYEKAESDFKIYDDEVRRLETLKEREERMALEQHEERGGGRAPGDDEDEIQESETRAQTKARQKEELRYEKAFRKYLRYGMEALEKEERATLRMRYDAGKDGKGEIRAAQTVTTTGGGYAIPQGFAGRVEEIMKYFGPMVDGGVTGELRTTSGNNIPYPTLDGTGTKGRLLAINTAVTETALTFGKVDLDAYKFSSDLITVPYELLEDEDVNLEALLDNQLAERLGRIMNESFTTGTGSSQPNGVVTASALGKTTASATAFTRPEIIDLIHSIDKAYRMNPKSGLMMHDLIFAAIRKLALGSGDATPLYQISAIAGQSDKIEGLPVFINNDMSSAVTTGLKIMLCGDFSKFLVRKVNGVRMFRLTERYADNDQVGFFGFMRADSDLIAANSIKHMITA